MQSSLRVSRIANRTIFGFVGIVELAAAVEVATKTYSLRMAAGGDLVARIEEERSTFHGSHRFGEEDDFADVVEVAVAAETEVATEQK